MYAPRVVVPHRHLRRDPRLHGGRRELRRVLGRRAGEPAAEMRREEQGLAREEQRFRRQRARRQRRDHVRAAQHAGVVVRDMRRPPYAEPAVGVPSSVTAVPEVASRTADGEHGISRHIPARRRTLDDARRRVGCCSGGACRVQEELALRTVCVIVCGLSSATSRPRVFRSAKFSVTLAWLGHAAAGAPRARRYRGASGPDAVGFGGSSAIDHVKPAACACFVEIGETVGAAEPSEQPGVERPEQPLDRAARRHRSTPSRRRGERGDELVSVSPSARRVLGGRTKIDRAGGPSRGRPSPRRAAAWRLRRRPGGPA